MAAVVPHSSIPYPVSLCVPFILPHSSSSNSSRRRRDFEVCSRHWTRTKDSSRYAKLTFSIIFLRTAVAVGKAAAAAAAACGFYLWSIFVFIF